MTKKSHIIDDDFLQWSIKFKILFSTVLIIKEIQLYLIKKITTFLPVVFTCLRQKKFEYWVVVGFASKLMCLLFYSLKINPYINTNIF